MPLEPKQEPEAADQSQKVKPEGSYLDWSEEDIDRLAAITPSVIADSKADARRIPTLNALLNAVEVDGDGES